MEAGDCHQAGSGDQEKEGVVTMTEQTAIQSVEPRLRIASRSITVQRFTPIRFHGICEMVVAPIVSGYFRTLMSA